MLCGYLTLRSSPWTWGRTGRGDSYSRETLTKSAEIIAAYFGADPYELFPIDLYRLRIPRLIARTVDPERFMSLNEAMVQKLLPVAHEPEVMGLIRSEAIRAMLATLSRLLQPSRFG